MAPPNPRTLARAAAVLALALAATGCTTRYDAQGREIYRWQFGQDTYRDVDYSNPRLPILPKWRTPMDLWPVPSPYEFNDLSRWSYLTEPEPIPASIATRIAGVGDNAGCVACNDTIARLALPASRADGRGDAVVVR